MEESKQARRYAFTWFEYPVDWSSALAALFESKTQVRGGKGGKERFSYICGAPEICPESGRPHIQGYLELLTPHFKHTLHQVARDYDIHFALIMCNGTAEHNITYCMGPYDDHKGKVKPINPDFWDIGEAKIGTQGKRTDINTIRKAVAEGATTRQILEMANSYQSFRFGELLIQFRKQTKRTPPKVFWFWGPAGTGKTTKATTFCAEMGLDYLRVVQKDNADFMNGFTDQQAVIFDDIRTHTFEFNMLLGLLDEHELVVNVKGSHRAWRPDWIFITAPMPPEQMFEDFVGNKTDNITQLLRRIHFITHMTKVVAINREPKVIDENDLDAFLDGFKNNTSECIPKEKSATTEVDTTLQKSGGNILANPILQEAPLTSSENCSTGSAPPRQALKPTGLTKVVTKLPGTIGPKIRKAEVADGF